MKVLNVETHRVEPGLVPQDVAAGVDSARLDLEAAQANGLMIMLELAVGVATTLSLTVEQHDAAAAGTSKNLVPLKVVYKAAADTSYTEVATPAAVVTCGGDLDTVAGIVLIELYLDDLDDANGFKWVSVNVAAPGAARLASLSYHTDAKFEPAFEQVI